MRINRMRRREFITLLGGAVIAWPLAARAQQPATERTVGILMAYSASDRDLQARVAAFRQDLRKLGWVEGGNLRIDDRWPSDDMDRIRVDAAELIARKPDVILVAGRRAVAALQQQTRSVPVVFAGIGDPVEGGVVASFAKPGGNFTGFTLWEYSMIGKMLEMLKQISPGMARAALVYNPDNPGTAIMTRRFQEFAAPIAVRPTLAPIHSPAEIERAVEAFAREPNGALFFPPDVTVSIHRAFVTALVARHHLPAIYGDLTIVTNGGLMGYGADRLDIYRRAASYVDRILRGERPGDLPVQQPTKYHLIINLKTAKALGLTVPQTLLVAADEVIE
jgi:putative tryptophan/tyrosine transport system substrate-binding protein